MQRTRKTLLDAASVALIPLRPLSIGEILDGAFLIVRRNARSLLGLPLVMVSGISLVVAASSLITLLLGEFAGEAVSIIVMVLQALVVGAFAAGTLIWLSGLLTRAAIITVMGEGFAPPVTLTLRQGLRYAGPMFALTVLIAGILSLLQSVASILSLLLSGVLLTLPAADDELTVLLQSIVAVVISVLVTCWLVSWLSVAIPVYVAEGRMAPDWVGQGRRPTNVVAAVLRSFALVGWRNSFRVALVLTAAVCLLLLTVAFVFVGIYGILLLFLYSVQMSEASAMLSLYAGVGGIIAGVIAAASLGIAYLSALQTLLYLDLRMRREGLDLALRFTVVPVPEPERTL